MNKALHIVSSFVGGSGNTIISAQLADFFGGVAVDGAVGEKNLIRFKGIKVMNIEYINNFVTKNSDGGINYEVYFSDLFELSKAMLVDDVDNVKIDNVVIDFDSSLSKTFFRSIQEVVGFKEALKSDGVKLYIHLIVPTTNLLVGSKILGVFKELDILKELEDESVVVWVNTYNRVPPKDFSLATFSQKAEGVIGSKLRDVVSVGEWSVAVKQVVDEYLQSRTLSDLLSKPPKGCDGFKIGRLKRYDLDFKEVIENLFPDTYSIEGDEDEESLIGNDDNSNVSEVSEEASVSGDVPISENDNEGLFEEPAKETEEGSNDNNKDGQDEEIDRQ